MRYAAGVLLILTCLGNGIISLFSAIIGAMADVGGEIAKHAGTDAASTRAAHEAGEQAQHLGAILLVFGIFVLVVCVIQAVAGVLLFIGRGKPVIFIAGALGIIAGAVGLILTHTSATWIMGMGFGIGASILAIVAAMTMKANEGVAAAGAPVMYGAPMGPPAGGAPGYGPGYGPPPGGGPGYGPPGGGPGYGPPGGGYGPGGYGPGGGGYGPPR